MIATMSCWGVYAETELDQTTKNVADTYTLAVGSQSVIVGKATSVWDVAITGIGMNVLGWRRNTTTLENAISITVPSKYTGYVQMSVVPYPNGGTPVLSLSRTRGTKDSSNAN